MNRKYVLVFMALLIGGLTSCLPTQSNQPVAQPSVQPENPSFRTTVDRGELEFRFEGLTPEPPKALRLEQPVRVRLSFKNLNGKPFLIWARPYASSDHYAEGGCHEASTLITAKEGTLERYITACQTPNEPVKEIHLQAVSADQSVTFFEGVISNVNYSFSK